jgi:hypothetical protein
MYSNLNGVKVLSNWHAAHEYFKQTSKPRGKHWDDDARPLKTNRERHYAITKESNGAYALRLYDSKIIQYEKPADNSNLRVVKIFNPTRHGLNYRFMDQHGWRYGKQVATHDPDMPYVLLPFLPSSEPEGQCAELVFGPSMRLLLSESWVLRFYRKVATKQDKERNAEVKERVSTKLEHVAMIMALNATNMKAEKFSHTYGGYPVSEAIINNTLKLAERGLLPGQMLPTHNLRKLVEKNDTPLDSYDFSLLETATQAAVTLQAARGKPVPDVAYFKDLLLRNTAQLVKSSNKKAMPMWHPAGQPLPRCGFFQTRAEADRYA